MPLNQKTIEGLQSGTLRDLSLLYSKEEGSVKIQKIKSQIDDVLPLTLYFNHLRKFEISFINNSMVEKVILLLDHMPNLQILVISETYLEDEYANRLIKTIGELHTITSLSFNNHLSVKVNSFQYNNARLCTLASMLKSLPYITSIDFGKHKNYTFEYVDTLLNSINQFTCNITPCLKSIMESQLLSEKIYEVLQELQSFSNQNFTNIKALFDFPKKGVLFTEVPFLTEALINKEIAITKFYEVMRGCMQKIQKHEHQDIPKYVIFQHNMLGIQEICISDFIKEVYELNDEINPNFMLRLYTYKPLLEAVRNKSIQPAQVNGYIQQHMSEINKTNFNFDEMYDKLSKPPLVETLSSAFFNEEVEMPSEHFVDKEMSGEIIDPFFHEE